MVNISDEEKVTYFGLTDSRNKRVNFGIKRKDRTKHTYVIGKTGMGKSTLLENMAIQDIQSGEGLAFIDPHGQTAELLLDYVPEHRIKDVLYFAPFDMEHPISFNVMEDVGADRRHLVANGLMSVFEKIWVDAWSARMAYILNNTLLALLEYPGSTLLGVNRMLADKEYRKKVVENITDPSVKSFWIDEFGKYTEKFAAEATPAIQNKVGQFTSNPLVRNIIGQPRSTFDIRKMMDEKKIVIINLSKGRVGEGNANLIGSMLITKIYLAAMSRADMTKSEMAKLPNFYLYVDEFQSFANKSFADILSEARKYKLNLTIAHQYIEQMEEEVRDAVFGNVGTTIAFRVGAFDSEVLEKEFAPKFTAEDLVNLGIYQIYLKLMIDGVSSQPFSAVTMPPIKLPEKSFKGEITESSRNIFAQPRAVVEAQIREWHLPITKTPSASTGSASTGISGSSSSPGSSLSASSSSFSTRASSHLQSKVFDKTTTASKTSSAPSPSRSYSKTTTTTTTTGSITPPSYSSASSPLVSSVVSISTPPTPSSSNTPLSSISATSVKNNIIATNSGVKEAISLNHLKPSNPSGIVDKKQQTGANVSALRAALASVMKNGDNPSSHKSSHHSSERHASSHHHQTSQSIHATHSAEQRESQRESPRQMTNEKERNAMQKKSTITETVAKASVAKDTQITAEVDEKLLKKVLKI
jgi:hypothetical protein